jgi:hypothetical protein
MVQVLCDLQEAAILYKKAAAAYRDAKGSSNDPDVIECELHALRARLYAGVSQEVLCRMHAGCMLHTNQGMWYRHLYTQILISQ